MKILKALYAVELLLAAGTEAGRAGPGVTWYRGVAGLLLLAGASGQLQPPPEHNLRRRLPPQNPCDTLFPPCSSGETCVPGNGNNYDCISGPSTNYCQDPATPCDVLVMGLGWAGVMTLHELQRYKTLMDPTFTFIGLEFDKVLGGRAQAAELVSGGRNRIMEWIFQLYSQSPQSPDYLLYENQKWNDIFFWDLSTNDEIDSPVVNKAKADWLEAFECLQEKGLSTVQVGWPPEDESMRVVLCKYCNWPPSGCGGSLTNLERLLEWYETDWENLENPENTSPSRSVPDPTYTEEFQDRDQFISVNCHPDEDPLSSEFGKCTEPSNSANIVDKIARTTIQDFDTVIKLETEVTGIDWCSDPDYASVTVTQDGGVSFSSYYAKRVVVTSSVGMLKRQMTPGAVAGDLFHPPLPNKLAALDRDFMAETAPHTGTSASGGFRNDMGLYKKLYVILDEATFAAADKPDTEFIFVARPGNSQDIRCGEWQQLDFGPNAKAFFPGSRAFVCTLVTKEYEDNIDAAGKLPDSTANLLITNTLFKVFGLNIPCVRNDKPFTMFPPVGDVYENPKKCAYFIRDGPAPDFGVKPANFWGGGWAEHTDRLPGDPAQLDDYNCIRANLECPTGGAPLNDCQDSDNPKLLFAGDTMCDRYNGYQHGGHDSGIQIANKIIKAELSAVGGVPAWEDWRLNDATPEFCDEPPATGNFRTTRPAKSSP